MDHIDMNHWKLFIHLLEDFRQMKHEAKRNDEKSDFVQLSRPPEGANSTEEHARV